MKSISPLQIFYCLCAHQLVTQEPTITRVKELRLLEYALFFDSDEPSATQFCTNLSYCCSKAVYVGSANLTSLIRNAKPEHME